ncbi:MAG TPA: hypothetical protein VM712_02560 [Gaiellales bacterium]|jgi:hypothetical protein|nr:hypothetical protein [Gaiellales bacterium]
MKRLLPLILIVASLVLPAAALATCQVTKTHIGAKYAAKSVSGDCSVSRSKLLGTATLNCSSDKGGASVRYDFMMPSKCGPSFKTYVNAGGDRTVTVSHSGTTVHVLVHSTGRGTIVVSLVSIYYYC